jgi:hypothetical protein
VELPSNQQLIAELSNTEDQFTERKSEGVGSAAFKKALVAFANSLPPQRVGVLYIGATNDGSVPGVADADKLQRTLRTIAENDCYPPIFIELRVLRVKEKDLVAAIVPSSASRPHFAGPAFVRVGSESVAATKVVYRNLLLAQDEKRRYLLDRANAVWTVEFHDKRPGQVQATRSPKGNTIEECRIEEVTPFFVRLRSLGSGTGFTEMLQDVHISYDDKLQRPRLIIWATARQ